MCKIINDLLARCTQMCYIYRVKQTKTYTMKTLTLETGKGLQHILVKILKPIKMVKTEGSTKYRATFEFIGTIDNPIDELKKYGKDIFKSVVIIQNN